MSECTCGRCVGACHSSPGWMTPEEARTAINAGLAPRLMRDWLEPSVELNNDERIYLLCPAAEDCAGVDAPEFSLADLMIGLCGAGLSKGRCVLLNEEDRCSIHDSGFKPLQCRSLLACQDTYLDNYDMARHWNNPEAQQLVVEWMKLVGHEEV